MAEPGALDYFYGTEAEQYTFYRIPKVLFTDPGFRRITADAKILYGLMLDRMGLSIRNGWLDEQERKRATKNHQFSRTRDAFPRLSHK